MKNSAGRLYRIISFQHAVQIFEKKELYFSHPSKWEDPYETRLIHKENHKIFAQCWCSNGVSDAMWRIYSPNHLGIRISTSTKKLRTALEDSIIGSGRKLRMGDVTYMSQSGVNVKSREVIRELKKEFDIMKSTDLLFMKRWPYEHESEYRVVVIDEKPESMGISININPIQLIDSILIDPRAPDELANALIFYFKEKIGYKRKCEKSRLYKIPDPFVIE
ncbi:DUF2971 domain-containing protein [Klebsiella michiganensis]|uniref:DUF2971 domain-containing protein n=1 Tax=Klebsiella michiganensis TaxID=1134687 RepID=UPI0011188771|nr:DUF2971 domain-containing protein [Klebsiella michiganensis]